MTGKEKTIIGLCTAALMLTGAAGVRAQTTNKVVVIPLFSQPEMREAGEWEVGQSYKAGDFVHYDGM